MTPTPEAITPQRTGRRLSAALLRPVASERRMADALRAVAVGIAADRAGGATPPALADAATMLWARYLKFHAADPGWPDRDRFVVATAQGALLLSALQHITGTEDTRAADGVSGGNDLAQPELPPIGQGFGTAVGMALAERFLAARFGRSLVDHRTWLLASDADMMQGVSHEAASLAGHLRLEKLTVIWDDGGAGGRAHSEDTLRRFGAYGWTTKPVDGHDHAAISAALGMAVRSRKPTLIACRTTPEAVIKPREPRRPVLARWRAVGLQGTPVRRNWLKRFAHHGQRAEFERVMRGQLPETLAATLAEAKAALGAIGGRMATRVASERLLQVLGPMLPELVGGSTDAAQSARPGNASAATAGGFGTRFLHFGTREHGMAAAMNGMAVHGGLLPYGGTPWALAESLRPALRLAARMRSRVVHVLTHDPLAGRLLEHLASLRAVPNLHVLRPADAVETAECWELALRRQDGPSLLVLDGKDLPFLRAQADRSENRCADGGYVLAEADGPRQATLIASGAEVALAMAARARLAAERIAVAVVSLPCWDLFARAGARYHLEVLGEVLRFGIEAGSGFGWERWLGPSGVFVGCDDDGAERDLTPEIIAAEVRQRLAA